MAAKHLQRLKPELTACLKELHLPAVRECYEDEAHRARSEGLSCEQYLLEIMRREREARTQNRIARHLRASKLPLEKTLETFDQGRLGRKIKAHIKVLVEGTFLERCENVLAFGNRDAGFAFPTGIGRW